MKGRFWSIDLNSSLAMLVVWMQRPLFSERSDVDVRAGGSGSRRSLQIDVDVLLLREAEEFLEAFLAAHAGLLVAAEGRAEEMAGHLVDPDEAGLDLGGQADAPCARR